MKNIFDKTTTEELITRIEKLQPEQKPLWGKMSVDQMLAHCNVSYELVYDNKRPKPGLLKKMLLKMFVKEVVVGEQPYKKDSPTGAEFTVSGIYDFNKEKIRLVEYLRHTQAQGENYFEGRESHSFGKLTGRQWHNMFYKHLDHHLRQFGV